MRIGNDQAGRIPDDAGPAAAFISAAACYLDRRAAHLLGHFSESLRSHYCLLRGRSPTVIGTSVQAPPRKIEALPVLPTFSALNTACTSAVSARGLPSKATKTSPIKMPACAAGASGSTLNTIRPAFLSLLTRCGGRPTGCKPTPRYPRARCPFSSNTAPTRRIVDAGMARGEVRDSPSVAMPISRPVTSTTAPPEEPG